MTLLGVRPFFALWCSIRIVHYYADEAVDGSSTASEARRSIRQRDRAATGKKDLRRVAKTTKVASKSTIERERAKPKVNTYKANLRYLRYCNERDNATSSARYEQV